MMKILLLQEMSGVHSELKKGLSQNGIEVDIATLGDFFKKYPSDINLGNNKNNLIGSIDRIFKQIGLYQQFTKYDIIQVISPDPFHKLISTIYEYILFKNKKTIFIAAGSDSVYRNFVQELEYFPPHDELINEKKLLKFKKKLLNYNKIIPVCYEYKYCMQRAGFAPENLLPFPIEIKPLINQEGKRKLKIFHPLNRVDLKYDFKGTLIIQKAFEYLEKRYGNEAEFISRGMMSYKEYEVFTNDVDILVDQAYSYSYGMSAAYGLSKGNAVLSGLESVAKIDYLRDCPVINIKPNVEDIVQNIEKLINDRALLQETKQKSREFALNNHDSQKVAQILINYYRELLES